jgi:hypothetical protein
MLSPQWAATVNSICIIVIAVFVVLAYFNGWG